MLKQCTLLWRLSAIDSINENVEFNITNTLNLDKSFNNLMGLIAIMMKYSFNKLPERGLTLSITDFQY